MNFNQGTEEVIRVKEIGGRWWCHDCKQFTWVRATNQFLNPPVCGVCDGGSLERVASGENQCEEEKVCQEQTTAVRK